ncbi:MAG: NnrS family protein [Burkholderiales bacterium]
MLSRSSPCPDTHRPGHAGGAGRAHAAPPAGIVREAASPHRVGYATGALSLALVAAWWPAALGGLSAAGDPPGWAVAPPRAHALAMVFSFAPMFFAGFLFRAGLRWLGLPPATARELLPSAVGWLAGWPLFLVGVHTDARLAAAGLGIATVAWARVALRFALRFRTARGDDRFHPGVMALAAIAGALAMALATVGVALGEDGLERIAIAAGTWLFVAPVFMTALHRMVSALGASVPLLDRIHPAALPFLWLLVLALQPVHEIAPSLTPFVSALDAVTAFAAAVIAVRWFAMDGQRSPLLRMLLAGFAWLGVALATRAASLWPGLDATVTVSLRVASAHALGTGFFGTVMMAFVTRTAAGWNGRARSIDGIAWTLFLTLQAAVVLRLAAAAWMSALQTVAAAIWSATMLAWACRLLRWLASPPPRPRDSRPLPP